LKSFFKQIETEEIISLLQFDKKNKDHSVSFSLVGPIGKCSIDAYPDKSNIESSLSIFCN
jgi:3-dehydroquinate synthetase